MSEPAVWYDLAHANGQNLWLSLREHALAAGNHTCEPRRAAEPSTRRQSRGHHKSDGSSA